MRIFVTGATGFIGSHFCTKAIAAGYQVCATTRGNVRNGAHGGVNWVQADLAVGFAELRCDADVFVHLAAHGVHNQNDWEGCFRWNVMEPLRLWKEAIDCGVQKFLIIGSCFEYGRSGEAYNFIPTTAALHPTGAYHASKAAASMVALGLAHEHKLRLCLARPFHVYGEGEAKTRFWPSLRAAALAGEDFAMTSGDQIRDFTPVEYVAKRLLGEVARLEVLQPGEPRLVNIGTGKPQSLADFAREQWRAFGATGNLKIGEIASRPGEVRRYVPECTS